VPFGPPGACCRAVLLAGHGQPIEQTSGQPGMTFWIVVAVVAFLGSLSALGVLYGRYRKGEASRPDLMTAVVVALLVLILFLLLF
jgi:hypothetical protein